MLNDLKRDLEVAAHGAPEYVRDSRDPDLVTVYADKYCEAYEKGDEYEKNAYYSCIVLKFWHRIADLCQGKDARYGEQLSFLVSSKKIDSDDVFAEVLSCINYALKMKAWQDPAKKTNAQACINAVISTRAAGELIAPYNLKRNEGMAYTMSLDEPLDSDKGAGTVADTIQGDSDEEARSMMEVRDIIQSAIDDDKIIEAIIFESMVKADCTKWEKEEYKDVDEETGEETEHSRRVGQFWSYQLVRYLNDVTAKEDFIDKFSSAYDIKPEALEAAVKALREANNQKKYRMIESAQNYGRSILA